MSTIIIPNNLKILIIGGTGSLGHTLVNKYINEDYDIYIYSRDENKQWRMKNKYADHENKDNLHFIIGSISDHRRMEETINYIKPNYIIVAAALKHIDLCEYNTYESIRTNIHGIQNVVDSISKCHHDELYSVVFVSTDKACSPCNVYGMCKAIGERIVIEKSRLSSNIQKKPRYVVVRYGNVISSRGSLLPKFHEIGKSKQKHFTVTDKDMTRFFMTLEESVDLIDHALKYGKCGVTYVPRLKSYSINKIAQIYSQMYNKEIIYTGIRAGEKLHEEMINELELRRTVYDGKYFAILPPYINLKDIKNPINCKEYTSFSELTDNQELLRKYINETS